MSTLSVSQFGAFRFNEVVRFDEVTSYSVTDVAYKEGLFGMRVMVYEPHTNMVKAIYDNNQAENPIESAEFEYIETGCGKFKVKSSRKPSDMSIVRGDRIDIHLMSSHRPWFSGRVIEMPCVDTDKGIYEYKGHGYFELLDRIIVEEVYSYQSLESIIKDLARTYLGNQDIEFFPDRLPASGMSIESVEFDRTTFKETAKLCSELAHNWLYGVNEERQFFFNGRTSRPLARYDNKASQWVGYNLESFELTEKTDDIANVLHVKIGAVSVDKSNFTDFTATDLDSIAFFGERGKVVSAPEIKSQTDAETWADYKLEETAWPEITGKARNLNLAKFAESKEDMLRADGFMRVSLARSGLAAPYYEPLNGYFRYRDIAVTEVQGTNQVKRSFSCRRGGPAGRIELMVQKIGAPGTLTVILERDAVAIETATVAEASIPEWYQWLSIDLGGSMIYGGLTYDIVISAASGDASNYYRVLCSAYDAPFSGAFYASTDSGASYTEDTTKGIIYRISLIHNDEFILEIKKVSYRATPTGGLMADVDLGQIDQPLETRILNLLRSIKAESLLSQSNLEDVA